MTRDLLLVGLSLFTWGIGEGMFYIFQAVYLEKHWGASPVQIGAILGAFGFAMALFQIPAGYVSDRIGPRRVMWAAWMLGALATFLMGWAVSLPMFFAGMLLYGVTAFVNPALSAYNTAARGKLRVERALTIASAAFHLGAVTGPLIGGYLGDRIGLQSVYRISAGIFILSALILFNIREQTVPGSHPEESGPAHGLLRNRQYLTYLAMLVVGLFAAYLPQPLTANYLQNSQQVSLSNIGLLGSIGGLSNAITMLALGALGARFGLIAGQIMVAIFALLLWQGNNMVWFAAAYVFLSGYRLMRSMALAFARPLVQAAQTGLAYGLLETVNGLMVIAAPLAAGYLYARDPRMIYPVTISLLAVSLLIGITGLPALQKAGHPAAVPVQYPTEHTLDDPLD